MKLFQLTNFTLSCCSQLRLTDFTVKKFILPMYHRQHGDQFFCLQVLARTYLPVKVWCLLKFKKILFQNMALHYFVWLYDNDNFFFSFSLYFFYYKFFFLTNLTFFFFFFWFAPLGYLYFRYFHVCNS